MCSCNCFIQLYKKNNIDTDNLKITIKDNNFIIKNEYEIDSIFGKIIGLKKYEVKVSLKGYYDGNKLKVIKE